MATTNQGLQQNLELVKKLATDLVPLTAFGLVLLYIHEFVEPFQRGFQCDDESIRYPYKDSTVSSTACYLVGSSVNVILILFVEYLNLISNKRNTVVDNPGTGDTLGTRDHASEGFHVKLYIQNVYCRLLVFLFGAFTSELMTDIAKVTAGRLRPHFIDVCNPIVYAPNEMKLDEYCSKTSAPYKYIMNYYCSGTIGKQRDARLSFLSGHSSYSAYCATFAVIYIQSAVDINKFGLLKQVVQVLIISMAFYTGLSRVSDYKHHWQDVLAGLSLGTVVASLVSLYVWPHLYKTYLKFTKSTALRADSTGEELNRFSY